MAKDSGIEWTHHTLTRGGAACDSLLRVPIAMQKPGHAASGWICGAAMHRGDFSAKITGASHCAGIVKRNAWGCERACSALL
jgi:hypothetical protein